MSTDHGVNTELKITRCIERLLRFDIGLARARIVEVGNSPAKRMILCSQDSGLGRVDRQRDQGIGQINGIFVQDAGRITFCVLHNDATFGWCCAVRKVNRVHGGLIYKR